MSSVLRASRHSFVFALPAATRPVPPPPPPSMRVAPVSRLRGAGVKTLICPRRRCRWRWWDAHNDELPGMAMMDGLTNVTGVSELDHCASLPALPSAAGCTGA